MRLSGRLAVGRFRWVLAGLMAGLGGGTVAVLAAASLPPPGEAAAGKGAAMGGILAASASPAAVSYSGPVCEAVWHDAARDRDVPVRIRMPAGTGQVPVILFSHGLGGSLDAGTTWGEAWARNGFAVVHLQHHGSDDALWRGKSRPAAILAAMRSGMTAEQLIARAGDVHFVLDELARRPREGRCDLTRIDLSRIGMSGHSFGAQTTLAVAGESFPGTGDGALRDGRIRAAVAFSPAPPRGASEEATRQAVATIRIPFFSLTGTEDQVPVLTRTTPEERTLPYRYMPPGGKYLLVLKGAGHAAFGGQSPAETGRRGGWWARHGAGSAPPAHVDSVAVASTLAFWKATLLGDPAARDFLTGGGVQRLLAPGDRFESK